jgi:tRNA U34 2-thiouridine synthase MnmA/TrmU
VNSVRLRYHAPLRPCTVELDRAGGEGTVLLAEPVEGVAPGQLACLMDNDLVVGHGTIA